MKKQVFYGRSLESKKPGLPKSRSEIQRHSQNNNGLAEVEAVFPTFNAIYPTPFSTLDVFCIIMFNGTLNIKRHESSLNCY